MSTSYDDLVANIFDRKINVTLSADDERAAIAAYRDGGDDEALYRVMYAYAPVLNMAVTKASGGLPQTWRLYDTISELRDHAITGFLEAVAKFDPDHHNRLAAIARQHVQAAVSAAASSVTGFAVPERTLKRFFHVLRAAKGNIYDAARLAPSLQMSTETFLTILSAVREVTSTEAPGLLAWRMDSMAIPAREEESIDFADASPLVGRIRTTEAIVEDEILVSAAFAAVDDLETDVVRLAYGFTDYDPQPDAEVAHRLGMSRSAAQRTRTGALDKMRDALGA